MEGRLLDAGVCDPLGRPVPAQILLAGTTAYVESAQACGLHLLTEEERDPLRTTSYGVGQLLLAAVEAGARRVVIGLGGSATNDAGAVPAPPVGSARRCSRSAPAANRGC